jgi:hypothetical protein
MAHKIASVLDMQAIIGIVTADKRHGRQNGWRLAALTGQKG